MVRSNLAPDTQRPGPGHHLFQDVFEQGDLNVDPLHGKAVLAGHAKRTGHDRSRCCFGVASAQTIVALLPPSSDRIFFAPAAAAMRSAVFGPPVKEMRFTCGSVTIASETPGPETMAARRPAGDARFKQQMDEARPVSGVRPEGLRTTPLPPRSAPDQAYVPRD